MSPHNSAARFLEYLKINPSQRHRGHRENEWKATSGSLTYLAFTFGKVKGMRVGKTQNQRFWGFLCVLCASVRNKFFSWVVTDLHQQCKYQANLQQAVNRKQITAQLSTHTIPNCCLISNDSKTISFKGIALLSRPCSALANRGG